jgi:hypothetical protein
MFARHGLNLTGKLDCPCALGTYTPGARGSCPFLWALTLQASLRAGSGLRNTRSGPLRAFVSRSRAVHCDSISAIPSEELPSSARPDGRGGPSLHGNCSRPDFHSPSLGPRLIKSRYDLLFPRLALKERDRTRRTRQLWNLRGAMACTGA